MKKRILSIIMTVAMATLVLAGCGGSGGSGDSGSSSGGSSSGGETLNFWFPTFAASDGEVTDEEFWREMVAPFEEENGCTVNIEIIPWDNYEEKYLTGTQSNNGPDVGYMYMEMFYDYINNGTLAEIDSYFSADEKSNYLYYDLGNILGGQYALPVVVGNPRVFAANMDVLNAAGIDAVPTSIAEIEAACDAILASGQDVSPMMVQWGNTHFGVLNEIFWPFFWGNGGEIVDADGNLTIDSDAGLKTVEMAKSWLDKGYVPQSALSNDDAMASFQNGEAAMIVIASSNLLRIEDINWDFAPVIQCDKDAKTFVAADCLVMFDSCQNKDLAAKLMKYVTSVDVMSQFHSRISEQPPITADDSYSGDERYTGLFTDYSDNFQSLPVFKGAASMYDIFYKNLQSAMLGELSPQEALTETTDYYNTNLK